MEITIIDVVSGETVTRQMTEAELLEYTASETANAQADELIFTVNNKSARNLLLAETDWTQLADVTMPAEKAQEWKTYRQALRDITLQAGFPREIVWPVKPV